MRLATPPLLDPSSVEFEGHLWILEWIDGLPLWFQLEPSGLIRFGDGEQVAESAEELPVAYHRASRHIQQSLDRNRLRTAVDDVAAVRFVGVATVANRINYELASMPPFLGTAVVETDSDQPRPPDAANGIFTGLGLEPVNTFEREVHARDFDPMSYPLPESAWYDGPAAGIVIRSKQGQSAWRPNPAVDRESDEPPAENGESKPLDADALAEKYGTSDQIAAVESMLVAAEEPVTVEAVTDRLLERVGRNEPTRFTGSDTVAVAALRSTLASRVQRDLQQ